ncbi:transcriptional regulator [Flammeovirgaceae bacterium 311]|nr:transcriptional regulator [Flammeovirgaceae bacterium 311]
MLDISRRIAAAAVKAPSTDPEGTNKRTMNKRKVLLKDIAKHLGVSASTVSMALKDHPDLSSATIEKIKKLAVEWGYTANPWAKFMDKQHSNTIGVIVPDVTTLFYPSIICGIEDVAKANGYDIVITSSQNSFSKEKENLNKLLRLRVNGIMVCLAQETAEYSHFDKIIDANIPMVFIDRVCRTNEVSSVVFDLVAAARELTIHLYQQGATKIALLTGLPDQNDTREKIEGYKKGLQACGLSFDERLLVYSDMKSEGAAHATKKLLSLKYPPDGILGANDEIVLSAIKEIKRKGLKIPQDIGLAGFADEFHATVLEPSLTSIAYPSFEIGQEATHLLLNEINSEKTSVVQQLCMQSKLVVRASSKQATYKSLT